MAEGKGCDLQKRALLGQYMTPAPIARFMASLFSSSSLDMPGTLRLLDAGAGLGALSQAFVERVGSLSGLSLELSALEVDEQAALQLVFLFRSLEAKYPNLKAEVLCGDFIELSLSALKSGEARRYSHAILNPPYRKIHGQSHHRRLLLEAGIKTPNLYAAFIVLSLMLLRPGGELVAIVPRSFCNGPYYRWFRAFLLNHSALRHIHLFGARDKVFESDSVLQENIVLHLERDRIQGDVSISASKDGEFKDYSLRSLPFEHIVLPGDGRQFIHIPLPSQDIDPGKRARLHCSLEELGLEVSTGPVVDFRLRGHLRALPSENTAPLIYPAHFERGLLRWPKRPSKKPNAIALGDITQKYLFPAGIYVLVPRFSSKEQKRRIVAHIVEPQAFDCDHIAFENHWNVFHMGKQGLPKALAHGLWLFLNTSALDASFRRFSGHTQVNASDLRWLHYPALDRLAQLGQWALSQGRAPNEWTQSLVDEGLARILE